MSSLPKKVAILQAQWIFWYIHTHTHVVQPCTPWGILQSPSDLRFSLIYEESLKYLWKPPRRPGESTLTQHGRSPSCQENLEPLFADTHKHIHAHTHTHTPQVTTSAGCQEESLLLLLILIRNHQRIRDHVSADWSSSLEKQLVPFTGTVHHQLEENAFHCFQQQHNLYFFLTDSFHKCGQTSSNTKSANQIQGALCTALETPCFCINCTFF